MTHDIVRHDLDVAGRRISCLTVEPAHGPTLLLIHGSGVSARCWVEQLRGLARTTRPLAIDLPGHGRSDPPPAPDIPRYADVAAGVLDALAAGPAVVVGHSLGGAIAIALAAQRPDAVRGLVLLSACARLPETEGATQWLLPFLPGAVRRHLFVVTAKSLLFGPGAPEEAIGLGLEELRACRPDTVRADVAIARTMNVAPQASAVRVPTLVLGGTRDRVTPPRLARELHALIPDSRLDLLVGAGHMLPVEAAGAVNERIARFVGTLAERRRAPAAAPAPARPSRLRRFFLPLATALRRG